MQHVAQPPTDLETLAEHLRVLAEPKRLLIFHLMMEGVQCNCELGEALDMAPNLISHHLRVLREAGLVDVGTRPVRCTLGLLLDQPSTRWRSSTGLSAPSSIRRGSSPAA